MTDIPPQAEHRTVPRRSGETLGPLTVHPEPAGPSLSALVQDISVIGIGLLADADFPSGSSLVIDAGPSGRALATKLIAQVRHATRRPDGRWHMGCLFSRYLTTADMEVMG